MTCAVSRCCFLALLLCGPAYAGELVINGDIEQPLTEGWSQFIDGAGLISRATTYDEDPDYEVMVRKTTGSGVVQIMQTISIPTTELQFSASVKMLATATSDAWAGSALRLTYIDYHGFTLGHTSICARGGRCPWNDNDTEHYMEVPDATWRDYTFNLNDELLNLPGIDPQQIKDIELALYTVACDC